MKIYGVQIKMPHSGNLSRQQALTILNNAVKKNCSGAGKYDKSMLKNECEKYYNTLLIEDINCFFIGTLN